MAWQGQISTMVRHIINDVDPANYKYTPRRLETTILVAAQLLSTQVDLQNDYQINVEQCLLIPDPSEDATKEIKTNRILTASYILVKAALTVT